MVLRVLEVLRVPLVLRALQAKLQEDLRMLFLLLLDGLMPQPMALVRWAKTPVMLRALLRLLPQVSRVLRTLPQSGGLKLLHPEITPALLQGLRERRVQPIC
jgi:hypothetical protein